MCLEIVLPIELERIFVQDETKHFSKEVRWDRWVIVMKRIVCLAYYFRSLFLRYICVKARDVHCFSDQVRIFVCLITEKTLMQIKYHLAFLFFRYSNAY